VRAFLDRFEGPFDLLQPFKVDCGLSSSVSQSSGKERDRDLVEQVSGRMTPQTQSVPPLAACHTLDCPIAI
jgi:hypothetical protein